MCSQVAGFELISNHLSRPPHPLRLPQWTAPWSQAGWLAPERSHPSVQPREHDAPDGSSALGAKHCFNAYGIVDTALGGRRSCCSNACVVRPCCDECLCLLERVQVKSEPFPLKRCFTSAAALIHHQRRLPYSQHDVTHECTARTALRLNSDHVGQEPRIQS
jgi:hypothetical protein